MKRKIVQHGPCTLTVSLPANWVRDFAVKKGDEITIEPMKSGLFLSAGKEKQYGAKRISVKEIPNAIIKALGALYKCGYDEIIVEYGKPEELESIHKAVSDGFIGFEIIDETKEEVIIKKVSEPNQEEFKAIFRRIFRFLITTAEEGADAASRMDKAALQKLIYRDENINKLSDFCRRVVNKRGQTDYENEAALYHVIEQLEKIGDNYKEINRSLLTHKGKLNKETIEIYGKVNALLREYEDLFFSFQLAKIERFMLRYRKLLEEIEQYNADHDVVHPLHNTARELYNLTGATLVLHL